MKTIRVAGRFTLLAIALVTLVGPASAPALAKPIEPTIPPYRAELAEPADLATPPMLTQLLDRITQPRSLLADWCECPVYMRRKFWNDRSTRISIGDAYQLNNDAAMRERGFRRTNGPVNGAVVVMQRSAPVYRYASGRWTNASSASGHVGWISSGAGTVDGGTFYKFQMRSSNWNFGLSQSTDANCYNVVSDTVAVYGRPWDGRYVTFWIR